MNPESEKPLRLFVNPFALWTQFAFKTSEVLWAAMRTGAERADAPKVAVIPAADAPARKADTPVPAADAPARKAHTPVTQAVKAARSKPARKKLRSHAQGRSKAKAKRRAAR
jgi:hypothetical protein